MGRIDDPRTRPHVRLCVGDRVASVGTMTLVERTFYVAVYRALQ